MNLTGSGPFTDKTVVLKRILWGVLWRVSRSAGIAETPAIRETAIFLQWVTLDFLQNKCFFKTSSGGDWGQPLCHARTPSELVPHVLTQFFWSFAATLLYFQTLAIHSVAEMLHKSPIT